MNPKKILLTGGSGKLGKAIIQSELFTLLLAPSRDILDLTRPQTIKKFFHENDFEVK